MTNRPRPERPTLILSLFDQKETTAKVRKANLGYDASGVLRYLARLELLPGPYSGPFDIPHYLARDNAVAAFAFENFNVDDLAGMARELEGDALKASSKVASPWIHGCASVKIPPEDFEGDYDDLVNLAHDLMKLFGVSDNRYFIAVHVDSAHIHVHFLYSRIGPHDGLRERDRRHPKFMSEEACAYLAHKYGFDLEDRHLSRVIDGEIVDLASRRVVRDRNFDEVPAGMIKRNEARKKVGKNDLYKLALVADHVANGELDEFRWRLAKHGILYEPKGTGSEFVDADDNRVKASELDHRFSRGRALGGACAACLPLTPPEIVELAKSRRPLSHDSDAEVARFMADRSSGVTCQPADEERWDQAVKVAMKEGRSGAPPLSPDLPAWPKRMNVAGVIGARSRKPAKLRFPEPYQVREREWQTEVWNGRDLIATIRYSRMAVLSKRDDDLRASLLAAKAAWGTVEVFGNPKFKKRIVALAAELDVPISNPELADAMVVARAEHGPAPWKVLETTIADVESVAGSPALTDRAPPLAGVKPDGITTYANDTSTTHPRVAHAPTSAEGLANPPPLETSASITEAPQTAEVTLTISKVAPPPSAKPRMPESPTELDTSKITGLYVDIQRKCWRLMTVYRGGVDFTTLEPNTMKAFCIAEDDLSGPAIQARLKQLYERQQADKATVLQLIDEDAGQVSPVASPYGKGPVSMKLQTADRTLADLFTLYQHHQDLHEWLHQSYQRQQLDRAKSEEKRRFALDAIRPVSPDMSIKDEDTSPAAFDHGEGGHKTAPDDAAGVAHHKQATVIAEAVSSVDQPTAGKSPPDPEASCEVERVQSPAAPPVTAMRAGSKPPSEPGNIEAIQNKDAKRLEYEARCAAELADLKKPRIFGMNGGSRIADPKASTPADAPIRESKDTSLPAAKEQPVDPAYANPQQEAAKAAAAIGNHK